MSADIPESVTLLGIECPLDTRPTADIFPERKVYAFYRGRLGTVHIRACLSDGIAGFRAPGDPTWCGEIRVREHRQPVLWGNIGAHSEGFAAVEELDEKLRGVVDDFRRALAPVHIEEES